MSVILPSDEQLAKTDTFDAQMLARFPEEIHPPPRVIPDAQTQKLAGPAGTATPGFGSALFSPVYLGARWPCVLQRGPDRRHLYHQQQWQFVTQPFYQISFETSTACCSPGFHVDHRFGHPLEGTMYSPSSHGSS